MHALVAAFSEAFLVAAAPSAIGVVVALFLREARHPAPRWSGEALALLERFPSDVQPRARRGLESAALGRGEPVVTEALATTIARGWAAGRPPARER